jgi:hypothetical protein
MISFSARRVGRSPEEVLKFSQTALAEFVRDAGDRIDDGLKLANMKHSDLQY